MPDPADLDWGPVADLARVVKPDTVRPLGPVDVGPLRELVTRISEEAWDRADAAKQNRFFCFHHTRHMVFRFFGNDPRQVQTSPSWVALRPVLEPLMQSVAAPYGFTAPEFSKAMLARLAAGEEIDRHRDSGVGNYVTHKIHVPVQTNAAVVFGFRDPATKEETLTHLEVGQAYEVNNVGGHWVVNGGDEDRIHFIFEVFESAGHEVVETAAPVPAASPG